MKFDSLLIGNHDLKKLIANENKLKELADYSSYKEATADTLPKFRFNGALIREFKEVLMSEISPLLE